MTGFTAEGGAVIEKPMSLKSITLSLWKRVAEPRVQRLVFFAVYLCHIAAGLAVFITHPPSLTYVLGQPVAFLWPIILATGGIVGAATVLPGWNAFERIAISLLVTGIALCSIYVLGVPGVNSGERVALLFLIAPWAIIFVGRLWEIRLYSTAPPSHGG